MKEYTKERIFGFVLAIVAIVLFLTIIEALSIIKEYVNRSIEQISQEIEKRKSELTNYEKEEIKKIIMDIHKESTKRFDEEIKKGKATAKDKNGKYFIDFGLEYEIFLTIKKEMLKKYQRYLKEYDKRSPEDKELVINFAIESIIEKVEVVDQKNWLQKILFDYIFGLDKNAAVEKRLEIFKVIITEKKFEKYGIVITKNKAKVWLIPYYDKKQKPRFFIQKPEYGSLKIFLMAKKNNNWYILSFWYF